MRRDIVVVGGSRGGVPALMDIVAALPAGLPAAILVVMHIGAHRTVLPGLIAARGAMPARHAEHGEALAPGAILVAVPDQHLLVAGGRVQLVHGPKENHTRPAIDPLFRSVATDQGERVIGVVLSGGQDDGTAGLQAIKACGGLAIVQHPTSAQEPSMPMSAITYAPVDYVRTPRQIADLLVELAGQPVAATRPVPDQLLHELANFHGAAAPMANLDAIGRPSHLTCPDCHGVLWEVQGSRPPRFRCHTGHAFTTLALEDTQRKSMEESLWAAVRVLQERETLLRRIADGQPPDAPGETAAGWSAQADVARDHAERLKSMIESPAD